MARYPLGQPIRLSTTVTDVTGAPVDAGALTLLVKIRAADGSQTTTGTYTTPSHDGTGLYHQDIPVTDLVSAGHYQYTWTATGTGAGVSFGDFDVFDPFEDAILPLADAKDALNIPQTTTTYDSELSAYIATIQASLEGSTGGPVMNRTITERAELTGAYTVLQVRARPLVSVTRITSVASGTDLDLTSGLDLDANAGTIRRKLGYPFYGPFFAWLPVMSVTYVAGWGTTVPATFNVFARLVIQHLWETQHGPAGRPQMGIENEMVTLPGWGYAIPAQAAQLLKGGINGIPFLLEAYV